MFARILNQVKHLRLIHGAAPGDMQFLMCPYSPALLRSPVHLTVQGLPDVSVGV